MENFKLLVNSAFRKGLFHLIFSNFLVQFLSFGLVLFLANYLSQADVGNLKLIQSYTAFFILLGGFGFNSSVLKFCSEDISREERFSCFFYALKAVLFLSVLSFILMVGFNFLYFIPTRAPDDTWPYYYSISILFAPASFLVLAYLQSQKRVKFAAKVQASVRLVFVFLIFVSAIFYGFWGVVVATVVSYFVGLLAYIPSVFDVIRNAKEYHSKKRLFDYSSYVFIGALITVVTQNLDVYILGFLDVDSATIGVYTIATIFFLSGTVITGTIQTIITPYFSERQFDLKWVKEKANYYQKKLVLISIPMSVLLMLASYLLVTFYFGDDYSQAIPISFILIAKYFFWCSFCVYGAVLFSIGVVKEGIYISIVMLIVNLVFSFFLFPFYGVYGVAVAQVIASLAQLLLVNWLFKIKVVSLSIEAV